MVVSEHDQCPLAQHSSSSSITSSINIMIPHAFFLAFAILVAAVPTSSSPHALSPRAEPPCEPWSDECREVITANACFAAYVPAGDIPTVLKCVDVDDSAVAERKLCNCYGCAETTVQDFATDILGCKA